MKSNLIAILLLLLANEANAQSTQTMEPFKPAQVSGQQQAMPNLNLQDWNKTAASPSAPKSGITIFSFDYTKLLEWLIPRKHPKIPPECDPKYFINDSIPNPPVIKEDSVRLTKPPV
jgi:hypothetical protein